MHSVFSFWAPICSNGNLFASCAIASTVLRRRKICLLFPPIRLLAFFYIVLSSWSLDACMKRSKGIRNARITAGHPCLHTWFKRFFVRTCLNELYFAHCDKYIYVSLSIVFSQSVSYGPVSSIICIPYSNLIMFKRHPLFHCHSTRRWSIMWHKVHSSSPYTMDHVAILLFIRF